MLRTMFYTFAVPTLLMVLPASLTWQAVPWETLLPMVGTGVGTVAIVAFFVNGLRHAPAHLLAPFGYAAVVFAALLDWLFFGLIPNTMTVAGVLVVTVSCFLIMRTNRPRP